MIGQGGGREGGVEETGECCLQWRSCMMGQGGGRGFPMDKIGMGVGMLGRGGGRCFTVVPVGGCVP